MSMEDNMSTSTIVEPTRQHSDAKPSPPAIPKQRISWRQTTSTFLKTGTCSEAAAKVINRAFGHRLELEEHGVMPLAGGIAQCGHQCGLLWGGALAAGARALQLHGPGPSAEGLALTAARRIVRSFHTREHTIDCFEITDTDWKKKSQLILNFLKGGPVTCLRLAARTIRTELDDIDSTLAAAEPTSFCSPVSCAAELVRRTGGSDQHATMAAGFAGGIGLSGGGCGALGAAVWLIGMDCARTKQRYDVVNSRVGPTIDGFLRCTGFKFECHRIVGRRFTSVEDHGAHVRDGGCAEIIDTLAASVSKQVSRPQDG
jgi:hypothetical protein